MKKSNKFFKYIIAISLCFVFLFVGIFSAFAWSFVGVTGDQPYSFGDFLINNIKISITAGDGLDLIESVSVSPVDAYYGAVRFELHMYEKFVESYDYLLSVTLNIPEEIANSSYFYLGSYDLWLRRNGEYVIDDVWSSWRYSNYSGQQNSKYRITSFDSFPTVRVVYDSQTRGTYYTDYYTQFKFHTTQRTDTLYFYLGNFDMDFVHPDGEILDNQNSNTSKVQSSISATQSAITSNNNSNTSKVQSSISATQSAITSNNNSNTSKVQSSIAETESNIKANQDKNASDIQSNADKNTSDTISNTNKNHEEMLRGEEYDKMDGQSVEDYAAAESQLNAATSQAQSDSISFLNTFGSIFNGKHVTKGLLSVSAIFKEFFAVSWLSELLTFGLGLGIFGFILGTVSMVVRSHGNKQSHSDNSFKYKKGGGS